MSLAAPLPENFARPPARLTPPGQGARRPGGGAVSLSVGQAVRYALGWQAVALALLAGQTLLICVLGWWVAGFGLVGLMVLYAYRPLAGATVFLQVLLYQNWLVSIFSVFGLEGTAFQATMGTAFGAVALMAVVVMTRSLVGRQPDDDARTIVRWVCVTLVVVLAYSVYGAASSSPESVVTSMRNVTAMLLALVVGLGLGRTWSYQTFGTIFLASAALGLVVGAVELFLPHSYYSAINALEFWSAKQGGVGLTMPARSVDDLVAGRVVTWFNITGGGGNAVSVRIAGPNMHPISYAYVIAVEGVVALSLRRPAFTVFAFVLLVLAGIKGPLLMLIMTMAISGLWWVTRNPRLVLGVSATFLVMYIASGIWIGLSNGDFHVIGFMGGVNGLINKPYGHGIGVGGNLSADAVAGLDWQEWQRSGADFALESAVGVLIYQMGVAAIAVYGPVFMLTARGLARRVRAGRAIAGPSAVDALFIGILVTLANGVFQEEAYSPFALGLLTLFGGVVVSNAQSRVQSRVQSRARAAREYLRP